MAFPVTLNGRTYTLADFEGQNYAAGFPDALQDFVTDAGTSVTAAAASATAAAASETAAAASAAAAAASVDAIEGFYLGAQASNPTVDLNGAAVTVGDFYFNTATNQTRIYNGSSWDVIAPDLVGDSTPQLGGTLDFNGNIATSFESTGIDDNATETAITIDANENVEIEKQYADLLFNGELGQGRITTSSGAAGGFSVENVYGSSGVNFKNGGGVEIYSSNDDGITGSLTIDTSGNTTVNNFTSTGIDDNATSTVLTIDSNNNVGIGDTFAANSQFGVSKGTAAGLEVICERTVGGTEDTGAVRLLAYDRTASVFADLAYDAAEHIFGNGTTERMRIDSSGRVGIGTASPSNPLNVIATNTNVLIEGSGVSSTGIAFETNNTTRASIGVANASTALSFFSDAGSTETMRIDSSGNVGIGTSAPTEKLEVNQGKLVVNTTDQSLSRVQIKNTGTGGQTFEIVTGDVGVSNNGLSFYDVTNSATRMRIDSSGRLLLGCTTSNGSFISSNHTQMNIQGNASGAIGSLMIRSKGTTNTTTFELAASDSVAESYLWNGSASAMVFGTSNTERMRIDASGNVLVGTTDTLPGIGDTNAGISMSATNGIIVSRNNDAPINMNRNTSDGILSYFRKDGVIVGGIGTDAGDIYFGSGATATERMRIDSSGNLLVGTASPIGTFRSTVEGNTNGIAVRYSGGTSFTAMRFDTSSGNAGSITCSTTTTTYVTSSDVRLKENIVDAPAGNIDDIRVRSFDWKADGSHQTYGMVAQELVDVAPEAVSQGETDEDMWGVDYSKLVPMMIKEIQDLRARVAQLEGA